MSIGGRFKLIENFSENLMFMSDVIGHGDIQDISQSLELEFDASDPSTFFFSTVEGLFKFNRRLQTAPTKLEKVGLGAPTCLSMSDKGYLLAGFSCGSIALYHSDYTSPLTVWYHACKYAVTQIKWCLLYFQDDTSQQTSTKKKDDDSGYSEYIPSYVKYATRLCEFFAID
jgi:hypothetical protein